MARDLSLATRRAIVATLKGAAAVTAIVPVARIYAEQPDAEPQWPFIRYGFPAVLPLRASCMDGSLIAVAVHGFAHGPDTDAIAPLGAAIAAALDGPDGKGLSLALSVDPAATALVQWAGSQILRDTAEANAYHVVVNLEVTVVS